MRVAVTGIASDFGTAIAPLLYADPEIEEVVGIDLREPRIPHGKLRFEREDIRSDRMTTLFQGCEAVIHLAFVVQEIHDKQETHSVNLDGSRNVIEAAVGSGVARLVVASSLASYGAHADHSVPITEEQFPRGNPDKYYFYDKAEVEHYIEWWLARNPSSKLTITRLRPTIIVGPSFAKPLMKALFGGFTQVLPRSAARIQLLWESDLARAFYISAKHDHPGEFNIASSDWISPEELAEIHGRKSRRLPNRVAEVAADALFKLRISPVSSDWVLPGEPIGSPEKAVREMGWEPQMSSREAAVARLIQMGRPVLAGQSRGAFASEIVAERTLAPITDRLRSWSKSIPGLRSALPGPDAIGDYAGRVEHALIPYRDLTLHLEVHKAGGSDSPTLVFSPGMGAYARCYLPLLGKLCDAGYNVVAIDRPGHGLSEGPRGDCTMDQILDVVEASVRFARDRFGGPVGLLGSSLGGIISWYALTREPDVEAVACHNIASPTVLPDRMAALKLAVTRRVARAAPHASIPVKQIADFGKVSRAPEILEFAARELDQIWCWQLSARFAASMFDYRPPLDWSQVRTPTLVMCGEHDEMVTADYTRRVLAAGSPSGVDLRVMPELGHMLFFDHLDKTLPTLVEWLDAQLVDSETSVRAIG